MQLSRAQWKRPRDPQSSSPEQIFAVDVQRIVQELNHVVTSASRLAVLQDLFRLVDHDAVARQTTSSSASRAHLLDSLVKAGVINALCLQLGFVLNKRDPCLEDMICRAIGVLYQCSSSLREESLQEIGSELFGLLQKAITATKTTSEALRQEVMAIWHTCAESTFGSTLLLRQQGLLALLVDALCDKGDCGNVQSEALGVLKHVTYFAEDHRLRILEEPGLIHMLSKIPFQARSDKTMERTSAIFRNLALSPNTRLVMANQSEIVSALIRLTHDFSQRTTRNVMSTFNSLILEAECCLTLIMYGDGMLLNVLSRFLSYHEEQDKVVRRRAARIVRFMARDSCLPLMIAHEELVESLSTCAVSDPSIEVRMEAAEAFARCSTVINAPMPQHAAVLESFTHLAVHPATLSDLVARVLKEQASRPPNRTPMASHDGLLDGLARIAVGKSSSRQAKDDAINALYSLSCEKFNLEKMATPAVLNALVENAAREATPRRETSMKTLMNLASSPCNRKAIVTQGGMLNMLVQYATSTSDASTKATIKQAILWLVPLL